MKKRYRKPKAEAAPEIKTEPIAEPIAPKIETPAIEPHESHPQVRRSFDPNDILSIVGNSEFTGNLDQHVAASLADERNILLVCEGGIFLFTSSGFGVYEANDVWKEDYSFEYRREATYQALCWLYSHTDCVTVVTKIPKVSLIARNPFVIDCGNAVLQIMNDRSFKILRER